jgi:GrpB-like predicted nucleotidyltransferase (UPF0157 family)
MARPGDVDEPILVVEADPAWPALYAIEAARLRDALDAAALTIEHVGSTAVPGLAGKPVVDLLIGVPRLDEAAGLAGRLVALGYEDFGEIFIPGRRYLRRRGPPDFNVAIAETGGSFHRSQLAVRDYLRAHPDEVRAYAAAKREAFARGARQFSTYTQDKHAFVAELVERALAWAGAAGARG